VSAATPDRLLAELDARGLAWPAVIEHHDEIGSTSDRLKERLRAGAVPWTVVIADRQSAGRGRHGRRWISPQGNLYLSVLVEPELAPEALTVFPLVAGLAVAEALLEWGTDPRLKWPNDVWLGGRKVAGVLAEGVAGEGRTSIVLGIGVNVNADPEVTAPELGDSAVSLHAATGRWAEPWAVGAAVLSRLVSRIRRLETEGPAPALMAWRGRSIEWWGRDVEVASGDSLLRGRAVDVDERGALLLCGPDGSLIPVLSGEARLARLVPGAPELM
jgi:BirA family transcriptional regulator, biotin operon repressor / biotin---[acetyl-CoA-carboxylase] ligase